MQSELVERRVLDHDSLWRDVFRFVGAERALSGMQCTHQHDLVDAQDREYRQR